MGLTSMYNSRPKEDGIAIIKYAFSKGITFFDTSDIYGADNANEILVGKVMLSFIWELGIAIVPYSLTAHGFFSGKAVVETVPTNSFMSWLRSIVAPPVQLALAWILHQRDDMVPIPGKTKIKNLDENIGAVRVTLTEDDLKEISDAVPIFEVAGPRMFESFHHTAYQFADTPLPKNSK
ncbi:putative aldo-keto reductase 1 [Camellia lanceoleosa]|uniref:Aldo-keto reductase 1 n=1 Tax=Camellia lanceoleosa TaxID=1840588 RepID=A0ACC0IHC8_9ERIC|nr:putative aldo-keto reductase 1 [Camellia lanceoleosa]